MTERMTYERLEELERWVGSLRASGLIDGPLVEALSEVRRSWKENDKLRAMSEEVLRFWHLWSKRPAHFHCFCVLENLLREINGDATYQCPERHEQYVSPLERERYEIWLPLLEAAERWQEFDKAAVSQELGIAIAKARSAKAP